jgi:antitoxin component YwqK of YwqJK toxin-antitoxin module
MNIKGIYSYNEKGDPHGMSVGFHDNGVLKYETSFNNGNFHGPTKTWDDQGRLLSVGKYDNGNQEGPLVIYCEGGEFAGLLSVNDFFINGELEGERIEYEY